LQQYTQATRLGEQLDFVCPICRSASAPASPAAGSISEDDVDRATQSDELLSDEDDRHDESFTASAAIQPMPMDCADIDIDSESELAQADDEQQEDDDGADVQLLQFQLVTGGTKRGQPMLIDSHGYTYNIKKRYAIASFLSSMSSSDYLQLPIN